MQVWSLSWQDPVKEAWQSTPVFLPGKTHGHRSLVGLQSIASQRVWHDWSDLAGMHQSDFRHLSSPVVESRLHHNQKERETGGERSKGLPWNQWWKLNAKRTASIHSYDIIVSCGYERQTFLIERISEQLILSGPTRSEHSPLSPASGGSPDSRELKHLHPHRDCLQ